MRRTACGLPTSHASAHSSAFMRRDILFLPTVSKPGQQLLAGTARPTIARRDFPLLHTIARASQHLAAGMARPIFRGFQLLHFGGHVRLKKRHSIQVFSLCQPEGCWHSPFQVSIPIAPSGFGNLLGRGWPEMKGRVTLRAEKLHLALSYIKSPSTTILLPSAGDKPAYQCQFCARPH